MKPKLRVYSIIGRPETYYFGTKVKCTFPLDAINAEKKYFVSFSEMLFNYKNQIR
jgi:hypothetical protein